jgi:hypothetical protein
MAKKKASDSLSRLRSGITRETPAKRAQQDAVDTGAPDKMVKRAEVAKPVRISVDLPKEQHKFLRRFALDADVDGMRIVRALLSELEEDTRLAQRVRDRLL